MTRAEFIAKNPIESVCRDNRIPLIGSGKNRMAKCPFHQDKTASMAVNVADGTWYCHAGCGSGGVIDLMAMLQKKPVIDFIKANNITANDKAVKFTPPPAQKPVEECVYSYQNALGAELYQVVRYKPKTFRQRHTDEEGNIVWGMEGVERVLYRLPEIFKAQQIIIGEGEKDADNLASLGFAATCNVGGAGKWLDGYTESLIGKDVVICGDNDEPGRKHVQLVFDSLAGKVKTAKIITIPSPHKDVSDFIAATPDAKEKLELMIATATPFVNGIRLPIYSMAEIEPKYRAQIENAKTATLDLSNWLPSLKGRVRRMVPGELVLLLGDTGTGKTALLQNIALHAEPLPTLMFEMELPEELVYERFVAIKTGMTCASVETAHASKEVGSFSDDLSESFKHLFICPESKLSIETLESLINKAELKMGIKPVVVLIDYIQLIAGQGKRYERVSDAAEALKGIAKSTKTIVIVASQVHRPNYQEGPEIGLHSGKDSGSLENSAGLVIGAWRDENDSTLLHLKVLKNTKGSGSVDVHCNFDGATMRITERSQIDEKDIPQPKAYKD